MKKKLFNITSLVFILIMCLSLIFGFTTKYLFINIIFYIFTTFLVVYNLKLSLEDKNIRYGILHLTIFVILFVLLSYSLLLVLIKNAGVSSEVDEYIFENNHEKLKVITYDDGGKSGPTIVFYEKEYILGIKCINKVTSSMGYNTKFDLEKIYEKISNNDWGFCNYKLGMRDNNFTILDYKDKIDEFNKEIVFGFTSKDNVLDRAKKAYYNLYKENLSEYKPYNIEFDKLNEVWLVKGSINNRNYKRPKILVRKIDGKVLAMWHD